MTTERISPGDRSRKEIWQTAKGHLQLQMSRENFNTWVKDTLLVSHEDNVYVIGAPTTFAREWLEDRLRSLVKKTLTQIVGRAVDVRFIVYAGQRRAVGDRMRLEAPTPEQVESSMSGASGGRGAAVAARASTHANEDNSSPGPGVIRDLTQRALLRCTFDNFVVGPGNRLAHAAAVAVGERPGATYNPLFIYGGVGLGKTHLLKAIGHSASQHGYRAIYISTETFCNEFIQAIRDRKNEEFRARYRGVDVLLIDDIQFLANKEQTQEEFFHTFNDLHGNGRQLVICSDRPPRSLPTLEDRLRSRFEWGLITDIQPPDFETRLAILRMRAQTHKIEVPNAVLEFIAQRFQSNIRELEGSLNRVIAYARNGEQAITLELTRAALAEIHGSKRPARMVTPTVIIETVAKFYHLEPADLRGKKRDREIVRPRQIAMYLIREEAQRSLGEIGQQLGGRDHTTIMHGVDKINKELGVNSTLRREVNELKDTLYSAAGGPPRP